jgi:hypothetical protein
MEEKLIHLIGKRVHITFRSHRYNGIFNLTGTLVEVGSQWTCFRDSTSDYPEGSYDFINTLKIRSVEEVSNDA